MSLSARWEGKLLDTSGPVAAVELFLKEDGGELHGEFRIYFQPPDDDGCQPYSRRLAQSGPVSGSYDEGSGELKIASEMEIETVPVSVVLYGRAVDADPHATLAIYGSYDIASGNELLTLEGGGCVLWQYAGRERGE